MTTSYVALRDFRNDLYACGYRRADALFELTDAPLTAGPLPSPVHRSGEPVPRRGGGSRYAALTSGRLDETGLRALLPAHPLPGGRPVYAVDGGAWARCDAEASPDRGYYYHPARHSAGQPIVAGWNYQWLAQVGVMRARWTAPRDVQRVHPAENANAVAVTQIAGLPRRLPDGGPVPLFVFDAGDDAGALQPGLTARRAALPVRLRSGRCFYGDPPTPPRPKGGRPCRHGHTLGCDDPATWPGPTAERVGEAAQDGTARVRAWAGAAPQAAGPRRPGHPGADAHRAHDPDPGRGQPPAAPDPHPAGALAVVAQPRRPAARP
jgi:hypothetical protein